MSHTDIFVRVFVCVCVLSIHVQKNFSAVKKKEMKKLQRYWRKPGEPRETYGLIKKTKSILF